jgi:hypothetical protein
MTPLLVACGVIAAAPIAAWRLGTQVGPNEHPTPENPDVWAGDGRHDRGLDDF